MQYFLNKKIQMRFCIKENQNKKYGGYIVSKVEILKSESDVDNAD